MSAGPVRRTLALGRSDSPFYRSIRSVLPAFGEVVFRSERTFAGSAHVIRWLASRGIDQVLMPNPYGNRHRLRIYRGLRRRGVRVVASDRGALPDAWFFDAGFNVDSPSYLPTAWDRPLDTADRESARAYMDALRSAPAALEAQGPRRPGAELRRSLGLNREKVVFVPLQRPNDTVIRYFAGSAGSMQGFLRMVLQAAEELGDDWRVVVKAHPLEPGQMTMTHPRIVIAPPDTHVHDLLELADRVFVVNSGVGLLSLVFRKPTVHVGDAFYGQPGLATRARSAAEAVAALRAGAPPDSDKVERFVHHLRSRVYSFGEMATDVVSNTRSAALRRVTRTITFRELRILGEVHAIPPERVLVVSPVVPHPITRGSEARVDMVIQTLVERGMDVSLCVLNAHDASRPSAGIEADLRRRYSRLDRVDTVMHPRLTGFPRALLFWMTWLLEILLGGRQRIANLETAPFSFRRRAHRAIEALHPSYLLVNYAKLAPCLPRRFGGVSILDTHDDQTKLLRQGKAYSRNRRDVLVALYGWSERRVLRRFDRLIAINPKEVPSFQAAAPSSEIFVVPAFTEPQRTSSTAETADALFVGSASSFNVLGLRWFFDEVLPLVRARHPSFELRVVGSVCDAPAIRRAIPSGVHLDGIVPDIGASYAATRIVIAPIRAGAGMKIKVVEALGYGKPLVCTSVAAEGIDLVDGRDARIADDPGGFAQATTTLLEDAGQRGRLGAAAAALHARAHSPAAVIEAVSRAFGRP